MKEEKIELVFIIDKSGSMGGLEKDTIGGFNSMIRKQREENAEALVTTILFDDKVEMLHDREDLNNIRELTEKDYVAGGMTAMLDAIGYGINKILNAHRSIENKLKTLVIITTDGHENSSREYSYRMIRTLIERCEKEEGFEFIFLGANIDAESEGARFGIRRENAVDFNCDEEGLKINYECLSSAVHAFKSCGNTGSAWRKRIDTDHKNRNKNR